MTRATFACLLVVAPLLACEEPPPAYLELSSGRLELAVTDPALLEPLKSFLALMYLNHGGMNACGDLVDADLADLDERGPIASQVVPLEGEGASDDHAFGNVGASGPYSFVLLGSLKQKGELRIPLEDGYTNPLAMGEGSVIAVGCEEVLVLQYERFDVPIALFPAGLR